jgi:hypothetical protein
MQHRSHDHAAHGHQGHHGHPGPREAGVPAPAEVLPQEKHRTVQELQGKGRIVAMAGDGINDAPALAQSNVGVAMGHGTDIAMQSARVVLVKGDLRGIVKARRLSRATMANIRQNLFFAFVYNALGVPLAAGVLFPVLGLLLSPMIASAAMSLSSVATPGTTPTRCSSASRSSGWCPASTRRPGTKATCPASAARFRTTRSGR